jgi:hypothetical protein
MHHAREPASMMMNLYLIFFFIDGYIKNKLIIKEIIKSTNLIFIPILNIDGYILNNEIYRETNDLKNCMQRKNLHKNVNFSCNFRTDHGVDLNRNYGFRFNYDQEGASNFYCSDDYRGTKEFSEPETQAVRNFVESDEGQKIKIAFNYHAYGNLLIMPFNFEKIESNLLQKNYPKQFNLYNDFIKEGHFPDRFKYGNGKNTIE